MLLIIVLMTVLTGVVIKRLGVSHSMQGMGKLVLLTSIYLVFLYKVVLGLITRK